VFQPAALLKDQTIKDVRFKESREADVVNRGFKPIDRIIVIQYV